MKEYAPQSRAHEEAVYAIQSLMALNLASEVILFPCGCADQYAGNAANCRASSTQCFSVIKKRSVDAHSSLGCMSTLFFHPHDLAGYATKCLTACHKQLQGIVQSVGDWHRTTVDAQTSALNQYGRRIEM